MKYSYFVVPLIAGISVSLLPGASQAMSAVHPDTYSSLANHERAIAVQFAPPPPGNGRYDPYAPDAPSIGGGAAPAPTGPSIGGGATPASPQSKRPDRDWGAPFSPGEDITCYPRERACYNRKGHYMPSWTRRAFSRWRQ